MCDSYIGLDQEYTIDVNKVNDIILSKAEETRTSKPKTKKGKSSQEKVDVKVNFDKESHGTMISGSDFSGF